MSRPVDIPPPSRARGCSLCDDEPLRQRHDPAAWPGPDLQPSAREPQPEQYVGVPLEVDGSIFCDPANWPRVDADVVGRRHTDRTARDVLAALWLGVALGWASALLLVGILRMFGA